MFQAGSLRAFAAGNLDDNLLASGALQGVSLEVEILKLCRDPRVSDPHPDHFRLVKKLVASDRMFPLISLLPFFTGEGKDFFF